MIRRNDIGFTLLLTKGEEPIRAPLDAYDRLLADWKSAAAFLSFVDIYGHAINVRSHAVEMVCRCPPEALAEEMADIKASDQDEALS